MLEKWNAIINGQKYYFFYFPESDTFRARIFDWKTDTAFDAEVTASWVDGMWERRCSK